MTRTIKLAKGICALALLAALLGAVPWALWHYVGWPLPHGLPSWSRFTAALDQHGIPDGVLLRALACVVWISWAILTTSVLVEVAAAVRGRTSRRLPITGPFQPLVAHLVAAILVAALTVLPRTAGDNSSRLAAALPHGRPRQPAVALVLASEVSAATPASPAANGAVSEASTPAPTAPAPVPYVVQSGDTLWGIAQHQLGDPLRWQEIFTLNDGRSQPDGRVLTDPNWIYPGWTLILPPPLTLPPAPPLAPSPSQATAPSDPRAPTATPVQPPSRSPAPPDPSTTPHGDAEPASSTAAKAHDAAPVQLPSGSVVAGSFAAGVLSAVAASRLRRRRHYRPRPPRPSRHVAQPLHSQGLQDLLLSVRTSRHHEDEDVSAAPAEDRPPLTAIPDNDALLRPDVIEVGFRDDGPVHLALCDWPGLLLGGPGAESTARAWLGAIVTRNGPYGAEILLTVSLADRLLRGLVLPSVHQVESDEALLGRLEAATVGRTRRLADADVPDANTHRDRSPEDPFPLLMAVIDGVSELDARWQAVLESARHLSIAVLVLFPEQGADPASGSDGTSLLAIGADGSTKHVTPAHLAEVLAGCQLFRLTPTEAADLLGPVAAIHNDDQFDKEDPSEQVPPDDGVPPIASQNGSRTSGALEDSPLVSWPTPSRCDPEPAPICIRLLGPAHVEAWGEEITSGLRSSAYELLAWYSLRPNGATAESAIDALWPDASAQRGRERFWTALGNLRTRLHGPTKDGVEILRKANEHYRPDAALLDIDVWRFEAALSDAAGATQPSEAISALERAAATYSAGFYPNADSLWVEPVREDLHRRAIDAHIRLAELLVDNGEPDRAVAVLERAIEIDPVCEEAYRRLMSIQKALGHGDAVQRTWRLLQGRLAELDLEPEPTTTDLVHELIAPTSAATARRSKPS